MSADKNRVSDLLLYPDRILQRYELCYAHPHKSLKSGQLQMVERINKD